MSDAAGAGPGRTDLAAQETSPDASRARLLLVGLLLLVIIAGIRAVPALGWRHGWQGPLHSDGIAIVIILELVLAGLLARLRIRRKGRTISWRAERLRDWLSALIPALMIGSAITLLRFISLPRARQRPVPQQTATSPPPILLPHRRHPTLVSASTASAIQYAVLALIIFAVIIAAVLLLRRMRPRAARHERVVLAADDATLVRDAAEAGRTALTGVSDARLAIIACYLAMERSLSQAGTKRAPAETAGELLARASAAGLVHGEPPRQLTALFYEARFSGHEVPAAARATAIQALDYILADVAAGPDLRPAPGLPSAPDRPPDPDRPPTPGPRNGQPVAP